MRNVNSFIQNRQEKWLLLNDMIETFDAFKMQKLSQPELSEFVSLYRQLSSDLSIVRAQYPGHELYQYLLGLYNRTGTIIKSGQRRSYRKVLTDLSNYIPQVIYTSQKYFVLSLVIFILGIAIGYGVEMLDPSFSRYVIGDTYIDMTIENIESGIPMKVYQSSNQIIMMDFLMINNIRVAFTAFALGVLFGVGTCLVLFFNGIMVGALAGFFKAYSLSGIFWSTIMLHGTLELSAIIIGGTAGFLLGHSLFFPGDEPRLASLKNQAKPALLLVASTIPLFIIAAFIESHITPLFELEQSLRYVTIIGSILFMIAFYGIPLRIAYKHK